MSTKLRRMTQPQADREVTRKVNLFYSGLVEDIPAREVGDPGREGNHALLKATNVIPTQKTLKCRPTTFTPYCGTMPDMLLEEQVVVMDVNSYGEAIAITNGGSLYYRFENTDLNNLNDGVSDNWIRSSDDFRPLSIEGISALNCSVHSINHRWYIDIKTVSRTGRWQFELGEGANGGAGVVLGHELVQISFDSTMYDTYMKQRPVVQSNYSNFIAYTSTAYRYDFLYTFCCLDVDGNIIRETGSFDMSSFGANEWDTYYTFLPLGKSGTPMSFEYIDLANVIRSDGSTGPIQYPTGYTHLAVYRTLNKANNTPDAEENIKADLRGGLLNMDFRLVIALDLTGLTQSFDVPDSKITTARVLPTFQYIPIPYTGLSGLVNGTYFGTDANIVYYSDIGATPEALGFCYPGIQQINLEQEATAICGMQNAVVITSRNNTWRFATANQTYLKSAIPGRILAQIQSFSTIEGTGIAPEHRVSMINWTNSAIVAFCSDHSIRVFDGQKWGDDLTYLKVSKRILNSESSMMNFDSKGFILFHYLPLGTQMWKTLRMSLRTDVQGAFSVFDGNDWPINYLAKLPVLSAGNPFMRKNSLVPFGSGILFWDRVTRTFKGYSEMEDYYQWPCTSPCIIGVGTFTGENMSYWTTHQESHLYVDPTFSTGFTPGGIQAEISGLYAGNRTAIYDNATTITGNFLDGEDIIFTKNIGGYRGYNITFTFPDGGYEIVGIDSKFRVIDRPVIAAVNLTTSLEASWQSKLFSRYISRYSLQNTTNAVSSGPIISTLYNTLHDPLAEETEQSWAIHPTFVQMNVPHGGNSLINRAIGVWFKTDGAHPNFSVNFFGIDYQIKALTGPTRTEIWQNGLLVVTFNEVYVNDTQWHYFAVQTADAEANGTVQLDKDFITAPMNGTTGIDYSVLPIDIDFFDLTVLDTDNTINWEELSLNYYTNLRNYSRE